MPYTTPTAAAFKVRYPKFAAVADETIDAMLAEAAATAVDTTWIEATYQPAIMAYAGHEMVGEGLGTDVDAQLGGFKRLKVGPLELERDTGRSGSTSSLQDYYATTVYGRQYWRLLRANKGGPRVVTSADR